VLWDDLLGPLSFILWLPAKNEDKGVKSTTTIALAIGVLLLIVVNRKLDVFTLQLP
jgi:hypothetical protein